jgi:hypothetical protein
MDRSLIILLVLIGLVYLAWRSAQRQTQLARLREQAHSDRSSCTLEPQERPDGRGFVVVMADGRRSDSSGLSWDDAGLEIIAVSGFRPASDAGGASAFAPGRNVELIDGDEPGDPLLWVWDPALTSRAGTIPAQDAGRVRRWMDAGEVGECVVVWEERSGTRRTGLQLLLVHRDLVIDS